MKIAAVSIRKIRGPKSTMCQPRRAGQFDFFLREPFASGPTARRATAWPAPTPQFCCHVLLLRMGQNTQLFHISRSLTITRPPHRVVDAHENITAALFAGLDDITAQFVDVSLARLDDTVLTQERNKGSNTQFGQLLDEELAAIPLGNGGRDFEGEGQFAARRLSAGDVDVDQAARQGHNAGRVFMAVAVEEGDLVAGAEPANRGKMVGFRALQWSPAQAAKGN